MAHLSRIKQKSTLQPQITHAVKKTRNKQVVALRTHEQLWSVITICSCLARTRARNKRRTQNGLLHWYLIMRTRRLHMH